MGTQRRETTKTAAAGRTAMKMQKKEIGALGAGWEGATEENKGGGRKTGT